MARRTDSPYPLLAVAIVTQALKDYGKARKKLRVCPGNRDALNEVIEIREFFSSGWFQLLKELAPETLHDGMLEEME